MMFDSDYRELKAKLHTKVLNEVQLENLYRLGEESARDQIAQIIREMLQRENTPLALAEREKIAREILDEVFGLGPLEPLLIDPTISDILVNSSKIVYIERRGVLEKTDVTFNDDAHVLRIIERIVSRVGRRIDESAPMVDARLPDGSRVNAIIPPLALDGPILSIRRFGRDPLTADDLLTYKSLTKPMLEL